MDAITTWETAQARIRDELGWVRTQPWLEELRPRSVERGVVTLESPTTAIRSVTYEHRAVVEAALAEVMGRPAQLKVAIDRKRKRPPKKKKAPAPDVEATFESERTSRQHRLASFVAGPSNEIPLSFAREAVSNPGQWHPLVFYGGPGSGKTHLLHGIVNGFRRRWPARQVVYSSSGRFSRQFVQALRKRRTRGFRDLYRASDLLVLDDLQDLAGRPSAEKELNHTLDYMLHNGGQVVVAVNGSPKRVPNLSPALEGRLMGGQVVEVRPPDRPTRLEIIKAGCAERSLRLLPAVAEQLATSALGVRELIAAMTRLQAHVRHVEARLDAATVTDLLADLTEGKLAEPTPAAIRAFVAEKLAVDPSQLTNRSRKGTSVAARQLAMGLLRELTPLTLREVGGHFGNRSAAAVHFAQDKARDLLANEPTMRLVWDEALRTFKNSG